MGREKSENVLSMIQLHPVQESSQQGPQVCSSIFFGTVTMQDVFHRKEAHPPYCWQAAAKLPCK